MKSMFENNEFFTDVKNNPHNVKVEVKASKPESNILFGLISIISSIIDFCIMFGGYFVLNFATEITERPLHNVKLMVYTAIIVFSLSAIIFGMIGIADFFKKKKSSTSMTVSTVISILGLILGAVTVIMSFVFFFK